MSKGIVVRARKAFVGNNTVIGFQEGIDVEAEEAHVDGNFVESRDSIIQHLGLTTDAPNELVVQAIRESSAGQASPSTLDRLRGFLASSADVATLSAALISVAGSPYSQQAIRLLTGS